MKRRRKRKSKRKRIIIREEYEKKGNKMYGKVN